MKTGIYPNLEVILMVELHFWITIREHWLLDDENISDKIRLINQKIKDNRLSDIKIKVKNGEYYLEHTLFTNHFSQEVRETLELFYKISEIAPGSYGLLYIHNDEDKKNYNSFCVYKAAKGKVTKLEDVYLSPYIPIVEE